MHYITQIYEIQTPAEAEAMIEAGVDHIGSVLVNEEYRKQPEIKKTIETVTNSKSKSSLIPLFRNIDTLKEVIDYYQPNILHFCDHLRIDGHFSAMAENEAILNIQHCIRDTFPGLKLMRSIPIPPYGNGFGPAILRLAELFLPVSDFFLTDTLLLVDSDTISNAQPVSGYVGITGQTCDWDIAAQLVSEFSVPVILAGGISPENVSAGIKKVKPAGVDSCTQTNASDPNGRPIRFKKDLSRVKKLVKNVRVLENSYQT